MGMLIAGHQGEAQPPTREYLELTTMRESMGPLGNAEILHRLYRLKHAMRDIDTSTQEYQEKKQAAKRFVESFGETIIPYTIKKQKYKKLTGGGWFGGSLEEFDEYVVTLPKEIQEQLDTLDKHALLETYLDCFNDEKHSFTVALLMMAEASPYRPTTLDIGSPKPPYAFLKKDKKAWNKNIKEREVFIRSCDLSRLRGLKIDKETKE